MKLGKEVLERSIVREGNNYRLKRLFERANAGEKLTIGFLGGSITQGSLASTDKLCYAYRSFEWFVNSFPKAEFTYVNAGIGGTTSQFGASRADKDLLSKNPDFVVVEFSVNDSNNAFFKESYEGLVRKIWNYKTAPAVVVLHNVQYDDGVSAEEVHAEVGEYYSLPAVSVKKGEYQEILAGRLERSAVTPDMLHPNDLGHEMLAEQLCYLLERIKNAPDIDNEFVFPAESLTANRFELAGRIQNDADCIILDGFKKDESKKLYSWDHFHEGWTATKAGEKISFELEAAVVAIQYRKTPEKPAPIAEVILDGEKSFILDGNFNETWGDCLYCETILDSSKKQHHRLEITLTESHEGDIKPFYLLSVLYA